jgi:glycosyltransferase involved in cell wall biosynthesis
MSVNNQPLVSIGIPVYNGENFIREALDSIVNQTYQNLEIIVSDNASADKTKEICESYQIKDDRIKYIRLNENQGAAVNFNNTFDLATGKYFKWASHDDYLDSTYIEKCITYLENHPDTHLCHSKKNIVNKNSEIIRRLDFPGLEIDSDKVYNRFRVFLKTFRFFHDDADVVFGVFRSSELSKTQKIANYNSSDFTLTAEIVILGKLHIIPEYIFYRRFHQKMSTVAYNSKASRAKWFDTKKESTNLIQYFPFLLWFSEFIRFIGGSNITFFEKLRLSFSAVEWLLARIYFRIVVRFKIKHPTEFGKVFIEVQ